MSANLIDYDLQNMPASISAWDQRKELRSFGFCGIRINAGTLCSDYQTSVAPIKAVFGSISTEYLYVFDQSKPCYL